MYKYYSTHRPIGPGTHPKEYGIKEIHNFTDRIFCENIGRYAWGYFTTTQEIPDSILEQWELVSGNIREWWRVITTVEHGGKTKAMVFGSQESAKKPDSKEYFGSERDTFCDWFASYKEAENYAKEVAR